MDDRRENQNGRLDFFHLHWPRDEYYFSEGAKILSVRKCSKPTFIYTEKPSFVMMSFNIIRTHSKSHKFLTALLNSRLIEYWLRNKGKMQGNNFQIDKEPLVNIPLVIPEDVSQFEILVDYLLYLNDDTKPQALPHTANNRLASHIEDVLNMMVYELYFESHMKEVGIDVLQFINPTPIDNVKDDIKKAEEVKKFYLWLQTPDNAVRQRINIVDIKSPNILSKINLATQ